MKHKFVLNIHVDVTEGTTKEDEALRDILGRMFRDWADELASGTNISGWGKVSSDGKIIVEVKEEAPE